MWPQVFLPDSWHTAYSSRLFLHLRLNMEEGQLTCGRARPSYNSMEAECICCLRALLAPCLPFIRSTQQAVCCPAQLSTGVELT